MDNFDSERLQYYLEGKIKYLEVQELYLSLNFANIESFIRNIRKHHYVYMVKRDLPDLFNEIIDDLNKSGCLAKRTSKRGIYPKIFTFLVDFGYIPKEEEVKIFIKNADNEIALYIIDYLNLDINDYKEFYVELYKTELKFGYFNVLSERMFDDVEIMLVYFDIIKSKDYTKYIPHERIDKLLSSVDVTYERNLLYSLLLDIMIKEKLSRFNISFLRKILLDNGADEEEGLRTFMMTTRELMSSY